MNPVHRRRIKQAFSAASDYDRHARVQRLVARQLAAQIADLPLPASPRILEIGCGTGFLTEALIGHGVAGEWLVTDISPEMVQRCRERVGDGEGRRFAVLDGEYGEPEGQFDLVCSSLAVQWFDCQETAHARMRQWLTSGGHCVVTTLGAGSFAEWRAAHAAEGLESGTPRFLPAEQLAAQRIDHYVDRHETALDFMRSLKEIGAHTADRRHRPLPPQALRRVMRNFEAGGGAVSYEVVTCHYQKT
ncbi:MAG: methyltransferase domain-containing protein [Novosphingobium sp.]